MSKQNTWKSYFADKTTKELIEEYESLDELINVVGCYGSIDVMRYYAIEAELLRRGCTIERRAKVIPPPDEEE